MNTIVVTTQKSRQTELHSKLKLSLNEQIQMLQTRHIQGEGRGSIQGLTLLWGDIYCGTSHQWERTTLQQWKTKTTKWLKATFPTPNSFSDCGGREIRKKMTTWGVKHAATARGETKVKAKRMACKALCARETVHGDEVSGLWLDDAEALPLMGLADLDPGWWKQ